MQEIRKSRLNDIERTGVGHAWLIGGIAVLALILAWTAFNRSGQDVLPTIAEEAEKAQQEIKASFEEEDIAPDVATDARISAARVEARTSLVALQTELEAGATYSEVQQDIDQIKANLEAAYENTSNELQSQYQDIQQGLESLEDSIRNDTGDALEGLSELSLMLEAEVRSDE